MVELVYGLHYVSSGSDQGKFLNGGTNAWASSEEFQNGEARAWASRRESKGGEPRALASPWMSRW